MLKCLKSQFTKHKATRYKMTPCKPIHLAPRTPCERPSTSSSQLEIIPRRLRFTALQTRRSHRTQAIKIVAVAVHSGNAD